MGQVSCARCGTYRNSKLLSMVKVHFDRELREKNFSNFSKKMSRVTNPVTFSSHHDRAKKKGGEGTIFYQGNTSGEAKFIISLLRAEPGVD